VQRVRFKVDYTDNPAGSPDFSFRGNPFKYVRLSDRVAVIYSYGPDRDDDFGSIAREALVKFAESGVASAVGAEVANAFYDPSNGTMSNGDLARSYVLEMVPPEKSR
jgi:hypothetical protein